MRSDSMEGRVVMGRRERRLAVGFLVIAAVAITVSYFAADRTDLVTFKSFDVGEFTQLLTPLFLAALFIERAVEVFISGWRGPDEKRIKKRLQGVQERIAELKEGGQAVSMVWEDQGGDSSEEAEERALAAKPLVSLAPPELAWEEERLRRDLAWFRSRTQRWAFAGAFALALVAAALGIRALELFVNPGEFAKLRASQRMIFSTFDIVLTAALLSGGSDAIHQVVETFTGFMEATKNRVREDEGKE